MKSAKFLFTGIALAAVIVVADSITVQVLTSVTGTIIAGVTISVGIGILLTHAAVASPSACPVFQARLPYSETCNTGTLVRSVCNERAVVGIVIGGGTVHAGVVRETIAVGVKYFLLRIPLGHGNSARIHGKG